MSGTKQPTLTSLSKGYRRALLTLIGTLALTAGDPALAESVSLSVGEEQALQFDDLADSVGIDKTGIVSAEKGDTKRTVILKGKGPGSANVTVKLQNGTTMEYQISVSGGVGSASLAAARAAAAAIPGLTAVVKGSKVHVSGTLRTHADLERFAAVKGTHSSLIVDLTEKQPVENDAVVKTINRALTDNGLTNVRAHAYGKLIVLEGSPKDEAQKKLAMRIAQMIYPQIEDNVDATANGGPSVAIEVTFIEVQKKDVKQFGLPGFVDGFAGGGKGKGGKATSGGVQGNVGSVGGGNGRFDYVVGPFSSFLKLVQRKSMSRVLSNPKLVTRSGVKASFHSGDTIFFTARTVKDGETAYTIQEVPVGISLEILPKLDAIGQIDAEIATEIKEIGAEKIEDHVALSGSRVATSVTIKDGYSILLSGLVMKRQQKNVDRVPLLADIPLIGELFKSRDLSNEETELLVLVSMNRVQGTNELIKASDRLWQQSDDVEFSIFD